MSEARDNGPKSPARASVEVGAIIDDMIAADRLGDRRAVVSAICSLMTADRDAALSALAGRLGMTVWAVAPAPGDVAALRAEVARLAAERDEYAAVALAGLSGIVGTPEKGYVRDGGPGLLASDMRRMREMIDGLTNERDAAVARVVEAEELINELLIDLSEAREEDD